ncbi:hypothetical protein [uncultured Brevundimonas sp.]|uniref:hypothetical protein n=1 Tax=uncultured Brevundimonas sp. TaxID=213418 RepID=UPI0025FAAF5D|nr:hypothetical protein [uncultured Brevundimonas sp.]
MFPDETQWSGFLNRNLESIVSRKEVSRRGGDATPLRAQCRDVSTPEPDWYLQDWMRLLGKRQADLVKELGWAKGRANKFYHGQHPYRREIVNELAQWLSIPPYELLMPPEEAMMLRRLREAALDVAGLSAR